jgi:hypothetical protein
MRTGQELTTAEEVIAAQLERRPGSLPLGTRLTLMLEQLIVDHTGRPHPGPHPVGWVLRHTPGGVQIRLLSTESGRTARALLEAELLDVELSRDYPPVISLTANA